MSKKSLPNVPSKLILIALGDLEKMERAKGYQIDMEVWHDPDPHGVVAAAQVENKDAKSEVCSVCLAGSVMVCSLGNKNKNKTLSPHKFSTRLAGQLEAINHFREGAVEEGLMEMKLWYKLSPEMQAYASGSGGSGDYNIADYADNKKQFKKDMRALAERLAVVGL